MAPGKEGCVMDQIWQKYHWTFLCQSLIKKCPTDLPKGNKVEILSQFQFFYLDDIACVNLTKKPNQPTEQINKQPLFISHIT